MSYDIVLSHLEKKIMNKGNQKILDTVEKTYLKIDLPNIRVGDTVTLGGEIREGEKTRVQAYEGVVIRQRNSGLSQAITMGPVVMQGIGIERYCPIQNIEIKCSSKVCRSKLYHSSGLFGRALRLRQRFRIFLTKDIVLSHLEKKIMNKGNQKILDTVEKTYLKIDLPNIRVGDAVSLGVETREGFRIFLTKNMSYGIILSDLEKKIMNKGNQKILDTVEKPYLNIDLPNIRVGDTVRLGVEIREGEKTRVQAYEGVVISQRNSGLSQTITVRRVMQGIGIERCFPIHSTKIKNIEIKRSSKVRRSKLYYLRGLSGKATRLKQRFT